jgi:hypothetical protein
MSNMPSAAMSFTFNDSVAFYMCVLVWQPIETDVYPAMSHARCSELRGIKTEDAAAVHDGDSQVKT